MEELNFDSLWADAAKFGEQNVSDPIIPISPLEASKGAPTEMNYDTFLNNALSSFAESVTNTPTQKGAITSSPELSNNFIEQDNYNPEFNPYDYTGNTQRFQNLETWGNVISKSFDDLGYKFGHSFLEYWQSYARLGQSLITADLSHLDPDENSLIRKYYDDQKNERENYIFQTASEEEDFFNKQFFKDVVGNTGFTLGTFAGVALELAFDIGITSLTGGTAAPAVAAKATRLGNILQDFTKGLRLADKSIDELKALKSAVRVTDPNELRRLAEATKGFSARTSETVRDYLRAIGFDYKSIAKSKTAHEKFLATLEQVPILGTMLNTGRKVAVSEGLSTAGKVGMSLQGFRRSMAEFNLASSEAAFESVSTYGSTFEQLLAQFERDNGRNATDQEFNEIKEYAMLAAANNYNTNTAILLLSNKLTFGNVFTRFGPATKFLKEVTEDASGKIVAIGAKEGAKKFVRKNSFRDIIGASSTIGKKEALKEFAKSFGLSTLSRFSLVEGFQENLQETSNYAWQDYYTRMYSREPADLLESVSSGFKDQFTEQGLKTFLLGAFTGVLTQPVIVGAQRGLTEIEGLTPQGADNKKAIKQQKEAIAELNKYFGKFYENDHAQLFSEKILNFNVQQNISEQMTDAAENKLAYEYNNLRENALFMAVKTAMRTNTLDAFLDEINRLGQSFGMTQMEGITDPDEIKQKVNTQFKEAFNIDLNETQYESPEALTKSIVSDIREYASIIESVKSKLPTVTPFDIFKKGSLERDVQGVYYSVLQDAAEVIAFNQIKSKEAAKRVESLLNDLMNMPSVGESSSYLTRVLTDGIKVEDEIGRIQVEIKRLQQSVKDVKGDTKKDIDKQIKDKQEELELLEQWYNIFDEFQKDERENVSLKRDRSNANLEKLVDKYKKRLPKEFVDFLGKDLEKMITKNYIQVLTKLINLKNKQAGINKVVRPQLAKDAFIKLIDFSNLSQDTLDYLDAVDALSNPDNYRKMVYGILEGRIRASIKFFLDRIDHDINIMHQDAARMNQDEVKEAEALQKLIHESSEYKELVDALMSTEEAYPKYDRLRELQKKLKDMFESVKGKDTIQTEEPVKVDEPVKTEKVEEAPTPKDDDEEEEEEQEEEPEDVSETRSVTVDDVLKKFTFDERFGQFKIEYSQTKNGVTKSIYVIAINPTIDGSKGIVDIRITGVHTTKNAKGKDVDTDVYGPNDLTIQVVIKKGDSGLKYIADAFTSLQVKKAIEAAIQAVGFDPIEVEEEVDVDEELEKNEETKVEETETKTEKPTEEETSPLSTESTEDILKRAREAKKPKEPEVPTVEEIKEEEVEEEVVAEEILEEPTVDLQQEKKLADGMLAKFSNKMSKSIIGKINKAQLDLSIQLHHALSEAFSSLKQEYNSQNMQNFLSSEIATKIIRNFKGEEEVAKPKATRKTKSVPKMNPITNSIKSDTESNENTATPEEAEKDLFDSLNDILNNPNNNC